MRVVENPADFLPNPRRYLSNYSLTVSTAQLFVPSNSLVFITAHPEPAGSGSGSGSGMGSGSMEQGGGAGEGIEGMLGEVTVPTPVLNLTEPIYETKYSKVDISKDLLQYWSYEEAQSLLGIHLPEPNMFVPSSLELLPSSNETAPQRTNATTDSETWVLQDTENFQQPKANFRCELRPSFVTQSPTWAGT